MIPRIYACTDCWVFGLALRFITVDDLCSSELYSLLPKIGSELSDKEKFEPQDLARAYSSKRVSLHPHTWMIKTNRLFLT